MKKLLLFAFAFFCFSLMHAQKAYVFNWADPTSLDPDFSAPDLNNRYGESISNVVFMCGPVSLQINDDDVNELSQKARFLYGYTTRTVEMRAYPHSIITVELTEPGSIKSIKFEGAKATSTQMEYMGEQGTFKNTTWTADDEELVKKVEFYVAATINCTKTAVYVDASTDGVDAALADSEEKAGEWYTINGIRLAERPQQAGVYLLKKGMKVYKQVIR